MQPPRKAESHTSNSAGSQNSTRTPLLHFSRYWFFSVLLTFHFSLFTFHFSFAQSSSTYFPTAPGSSWRYERVDLDSLQAPIELTRRTIIDSLIGQAMVRGQLAHVVLSRPALASGPADTTALLVSGDAVSQLMRGLPPVGPLDILDTVGLANLARQERWYVTMKFAAPPSAGVPDTMLRVDTLLTYDGTTYNVRIVSTRTRLSSRSITVPAGTFTAVPFAYKIIADAFVFGPVRLAETYDTVFVAQNAWIVKHVRASAPLPIEPLGIDIPGSYVRGFVKVLTSKTVVSVEEWGDEVEPWRGGGMEYGLGEPYPNPFNPLTSVDFRLANSSQVRISFVDLLGRTVEVLADGEFGAGMHRVRWNAGTRASGTYLVIADFRLSSGEYHRLTRKVMLVR